MSLLDFLRTYMGNDQMRLIDYIYIILSWIVIGWAAYLAGEWIARVVG